MTTKPSSPLQLAMRGVFWGAAKTLVNQTLRIVVFLILARLLDPTDFGLLALALTLTILADFVIVEGGWTESLVRRSELTKANCDSVFWLVLGISLLLACAMAAFAGFHSANVDDSRVTPLVFALIALYPLAALRAVPQAILMREFDFRTIAISSNAGALLGGVAAVTLALSGAGVWALVANQLVSQSFMTASLLYRSRWRPSFEVSRTGLDGVFGFVPRALLAQTAKFADYYMIRVFIGDRVGTEAVGFYAVSVDLRGFLRSLVILPATQVVLPSVRVIRDDPPRLRHALALGLRMLTLVVFPAAVGLSLVAKDLVPLLLGPKWAPAVPLIELTALTAPAIALVRVNSSVQYGFGRPGVVARLALISTVILAVALLTLPIATAAGAVAIVVMRSYMMLPFHFLQLRQATGLTFARVARAILPNLLATAIMAAVILTLQNTFLTESGRLTRIVLCTSAGIAFYALAILVLAPATLREARSAVSDALKRSST